MPFKYVILTQIYLNIFGISYSSHGGNLYSIMSICSFVVFKTGMGVYDCYDVCVYSVLAKEFNAASNNILIPFGLNSYN